MAGLLSLTVVSCIALAAPQAPAHPSGSATAAFTRPSANLGLATSSAAGSLGPHRGPLHPGPSVVTASSRRPSEIASQPWSQSSGMPGVEGGFQPLSHTQSQSPSSPLQSFALFTLPLVLVGMALFGFGRAAVAADAVETAPAPMTEIVTPQTAAQADADYYEQFRNQKFEARADPEAVKSQVAVLGSAFGLAAYWWYIFVPAERRSLAKEKRRGEVKEYLEEIAGDESRGLERWFYDDWLKRKYIRANKVPRVPQATATTAVDADGESAPKATPVPKTTSPADQEVYVDKEPNFWSFDNPLVTTAALALFPSHHPKLTNDGCLHYVHDRPQARGVSSHPR